MPQFNGKWINSFVHACMHVHRNSYATLLYSSVIITSSISITHNICCAAVQASQASIIKIQHLRASSSIGHLFAGNVGLSFKPLFVLRPSCSPTPPMSAKLWTFNGRNITTVRGFRHVWAVQHTLHSTCGVFIVFKCNMMSCNMMLKAREAEKFWHFPNILRKCFFLNI